MLSDLFDFNCIVLLNETNTTFKFIPLAVPLFSFILIFLKDKEKAHPSYEEGYSQNKCSSSKFI